jgi:hypothetical protein
MIELASPGDPISRAGTEENSHLASFLVWSSAASGVRRKPSADPSTANSDKPPSACPVTSSRLAV